MIKKIKNEHLLNNCHLSEQGARSYKYFLLLLFFSFSAFSFDPIPGTIPLEYGSYPATDLVCDNDDCGQGIKRGDILLPEEAEALYFRRNQETRGQWTLADLNPSESYIWKDEKSFAHNEIDNELEIHDLDSVDFVSKGWARLGQYRITVNKNNSFNKPTQYTLMMSKTIHSLLLRKALLRKLGYFVPAVKYLPRVKINFRTKSEKKNFLSDLNINNAGSFDRWVLSEEKTSVVVQDIVIMEDQEFSLNLAKGYLSQDVFQGKRIFDSLLVPYALTEVPESINMLEWTVGRIYSNNVALKFPYAKEFDCSIGDALWSIRRIMKLTEADWREIVEETMLPPSVKLLLFEKLKSRRNHLGILFGVDNINLPVNPTISNHDDLVDGEITKEFYDGYARRFKIPDPESPLSYSEITGLVKSSAITTGINALVKSFNSASFMGTDVSKKVQEINDKLLAKSVANSVVTGSSNKLPVSTYAFPTVGGNLILGREIVTGSYMGTDNLIQLVDTIGVSANVGVFGGMSGVYTKTGGKTFAGGEVVRQFAPVDLSANAQVYFNRTYSHVKPITSIKKSLKYPFKNILVPFLKSKYAHVFDELKKESFDELSLDDQNKEMDEMMKVLNENLEVGESLIVTDTFGGGLAAQVGMNLFNVSKVDLSVAPNKYVVSRLHIFRANDNEIHIYKDLGNINSIEITMGVKKFIPIIKVMVKGIKGKGRTKYYRLNLSNDSRNINRKDNLLSLRSALLNGSLSSLNQYQKPFVIKHDFKENNFKLGIIVFRLNKLNTSDNIEVTNPNGSVKNLYRRNKGTTYGIAPINYLKDLTESLVGLLLKKNNTITASFGDGNPGYTPLGKAKNKIMTYETELEEGEPKALVKLSRIWNGWKVKTKKALKILKTIKDHYGFRFYEDHVLAQTEKLFLYNINVRLFFYNDGLKNLLNLPEAEVKRIWAAGQSRDMSNFSGADSLAGSGIKKFLKHRKKYHTALLKNDVKKMSDHLLRLTEIMDDRLKLEAVSELVGGKENFFVVSKIEGFRIGDENGDQDLISNSFGQIGNENLDGPLDTVRKFMGMSYGEFYMSWLQGRVI